MFASAALVFAFALGIPAVLADAVPTSPGSADVFKAGDQCTITWTADTTGKWTEMNIELMSGDNNPMVHMRTVTTVDATKTTSYTWTCPEVNPYSPIYFYQFSSPSDPTAVTWTTRFTIASSTGTSVPAPQVNSKGIKWGTGTFVDPSNYNDQPSYFVGNGQIVGGSGSGSGSSSVSVPSSVSSASSASSATAASSASVSAASSASSASVSHRSRTSAVVESLSTNSRLQTSTQASATSASSSTSPAATPSSSIGAAPLRVSVSGGASVLFVFSATLFGAVFLL